MAACSSATSILGQPCAPSWCPAPVLVEGHWLNGAFSGVSHSYWCGLAYPYRVTGGIDATGALMLYGPAPIIDPYTCGVLGYEWTGNSTLRFEPFAPAPPRGALPVPPAAPLPLGAAGHLGHFHCTT